MNWVLVGSFTILNVCINNNDDDDDGDYDSNDYNISYDTRSAFSKWLTNNKVVPNASIVYSQRKAFLYTWHMIKYLKNHFLE